MLCLRKLLQYRTQNIPVGTFSSEKNFEKKGGATANRFGRAHWPQTDKGQDYMRVTEQRCV